jgi:hypothetical protein
MHLSCYETVLPVEESSPNGKQCLNYLSQPRGQAQFFGSDSGASRLSLLLRAESSLSDHPKSCWLHRTTCVGEVVRNRLATVLPANDVIDFMRKRSVVLMKQAVFTPEHCPLNNFSA